MALLLGFTQKGNLGYVSKGYEIGNRVYPTGREDHFQVIHIFLKTFVCFYSPIYFTIFMFHFYGLIFRVLDINICIEVMGSTICQD